MDDAGWSEHALASRSIAGRASIAGRVACIWLPRLPLRVEILRHPAWDGRPLVLGGAPGERKVARLCSPEAERAGVRVGLPLREVPALCPDAIVVAPDPVRVAAVLDDVVRRLQRVGPAVEVDDERLYLDLRGLRALYDDDLSALERAIRAALPPLLRPRLGLAAGKFVASVAASLAGPAGVRVVEADETIAFLAPLPIGCLPLAPSVLDRLALLGLGTVGALAGLPFGAVQAQLGPAGARAWRLAHGQDDEPVIPRAWHPTARAMLRFDDPLASVDAVMVAVEQLLIAVFADPLLRARSARQARLRALLADGTSWELLVTFKEPLSSRAAAQRALRSKLDLPGGLPAAPIDELALEMLGLGGEAARQGNMFNAQAMQLGRIAAVARQLRARYGDVPLHHVVEVEPWSRIPERRWALIACDT